VSSFFRPTTTQGAKTPAIKAPTQNAHTLKSQGKKAISLSLLLGLTPALAVTPAVHADAAQAKPAQVEPAQANPASTASPAASLQATPVAATPDAAAAGVSDADKIDLKVTTGPLNISQGGTVSVTTSPLSAEFRKKYTFHELALVERGSVYVYAEHNIYAPLDEYGGMLKDLDHQGRGDPDGSLPYTF